ncbi:MAG: hypothetical protein Q8Q24_01800 [bacterium]|nr:hypothetical protein [bacterium]
MVGDEEIQTKEKIEDPKLYFELFRASDRYKQALMERRKKINPAPDATEEEVRKAAEESDEIKEAFFGFAQYDTKFRYNPFLFPENSVKEIKNYEETVVGYREVRQEISGNTEENQRTINYIDRERMKAHDHAASVLYSEGVAPSQRLGKALVSLIMIGKKFDTFSNALENDIKRAQRLVGIGTF